MRREMEILLIVTTVALFLLAIGISWERRYQRIQREQRKSRGTWIACQTGFRKVPGTGFAPKPRYDRR
ncbi:MAG: hypothetical protein BMS9Abin34_377 [Patescibacteria group bacterium]|nr:MAG: hypothetical protein BMS9Abin34_377 [Patescibacteria group bacterium]